jgi:hypothetical protein
MVNPHRKCQRAAVICYQPASRELILLSTQQA